MSLTAQQLIDKYIRFFESKSHKQISSASLIPENDPTVLFTTAGMHPLVPYLMGEKHPAGTRLVNYQRCIRTGDIDEVGDDTHNTFFTMLGNWSLGDYFKKEAIEWSFEFLTKELGIDKEKLAFTVFEGEGKIPKDEISAKFWEELGVSEKRIAYLDREENWWGPAGQTGPCGPDTEMFYWVGEDNAPEVYDPSDDNWVEIWNDVFMQYNKKADGGYEPLAQQNVDTGMGLERILVALGGLKTIYETELFAGAMEYIVEQTKANSDTNEHSQRVIADHMRASAMIIADGIEPSNKDQGYILRRFIRRSVRHARRLGIEDSKEFLVEVAMKTTAPIESLYDYLDAEKKHITKIIGQEVTKFEKTLEKGLKELQKVWDKKGSITGEDAFDLYQSYGFPLELTEEVSIEYGQSVDHEVFHDEFKKHQETSRAGAAQKFTGGLADHSAETLRLHTATHLLHKALKNILGEDIEQKGSNITPKRLRFDFNYDAKMTNEQKQQVEDMVNDQINKALPVYFEEVTPEKAKERGAIGYFDDKYASLGNKLKVYFVGDDENGLYSVEICGGPHVHNTSELESFKITKEESCSAGVRRIKATVGANK